APLQEVRQVLVIAGDDADAARVAHGRTPDRVLQRGIARTEDRQPPTLLHQPVDTLGQQIDALLPGQPADDREQRARTVLEPEPLCQFALVALSLLRA